MQLDEAKEKLIQTFGALGTSWGVTRTMAQVHALLLLSEDALSAEEVMDSLQISRGNANQNIRSLIDWGLVRRDCKVGERREFFVAEKDMWRVAIQIIQERRKRELAPILQALQEIKNVSGVGDEEEKQRFIETAEKLNHIIGQADNFLDFVVKSEKNLLISTLMRLIPKK